MAAEYNELPEAVKVEVQAYAEVHVAWLSKVLVAAGIIDQEHSEQRARAIYAAVAGAQLLARSRGAPSALKRFLSSVALSSTCCAVCGPPAKGRMPFCKSINTSAVVLGSSFRDIEKSTNNKMNKPRVPAQHPGLSSYLGY